MSRIWRFFFPEAERLVEPTPFLRTRYFFANIKFRSFWFLFFIIPVSIIIYLNGGACSSEGKAVKHVDPLFSLYPSSEECGIYGLNCVPETQKIQCPSYSLKKVLSPVSLGKKEVLTDPWVIGTNEYRADSWVCAASIHSGLIGSSGGCVKIEVFEFHANYTGSKKQVSSASFDSWFPWSFKLQSCVDSKWCTEHPFIVVFLTWLIFCIFLFVFRPIMGVAHLSLLITGFFTIVLISDKTVFDPYTLERTLDKFFPALGLGTLAYFIFGKTFEFSVVDYSIEWCILGAFPFFLATLFNLFEEQLPSLGLEAGITWENGTIYLVVILAILLFIWIIRMGYLHRKQHQLHIMLISVFILCVCCILSVFLSGLSFHLHHYQVGLIGLSATYNLKRKSAFFMYFCFLGIYMHGASRWGLVSSWDAPRNKIQVEINETDFEVKNKILFYKAEIKDSITVIINNINVGVLWDKNRKLNLSEVLHRLKVPQDYHVYPIYFSIMKSGKKTKDVQI